MTVWTVTEQETGGGYVVSWKRKTKRFDDASAAMTFVKEQRAPGDRVVMVEKDGYRTPEKRRRWRQPQ